MHQCPTPDLPVTNKNAAQVTVIRRLPVKHIFAVYVNLRLLVTYINMAQVTVLRRLLVTHITATHAFVTRRLLVTNISAAPVKIIRKLPVKQFHARSVLVTYIRRLLVTHQCFPNEHYHTPVGNIH